LPALVILEAIVATAATLIMLTALVFVVLRIKHFV
jgi:hypothetical protein